MHPHLSYCQPEWTADVADLATRKLTLSIRMQPSHRRAQHRGFAPTSSIANGPVIDDPRQTHGLPQGFLHAAQQ